MQNDIHILVIRFKNEISLLEIPFFRGAILHALHGEANVLFHNHVDESSFRYSYPLIQYKRIQGKAAIVLYLPTSNKQSSSTVFPALIRLTV